MKSAEEVAQEIVLASVGKSNAQLNELWRGYLANVIRRDRREQVLSFSAALGQALIDRFPSQALDIGKVMGTVMHECLKSGEVGAGHGSD